MAKSGATANDPRVALVLAAVLVAYLFATAGVAQLMMLSGATEPRDNHYLFGLSLAMFFIVPLIIASGLVSALILHAYRFKNFVTFLGNAALSAILAAYAFLFNFGVADNLGVILEPLPKNAADVGKGWAYAVPSFVSTLARVFSDIPSVVATEWRSFAGCVFVALVFAIVCGSLFWRFVVHRRIA